MSKINVATLLCLGLILTACKPSGSGEKAGENLINPVHIEGILEGGAQKDVILEEMAAREYIPIDTAICDAEGRFLMSFKAQDPAFYVLRTGGRGYITLLIEPGEHIWLKGQYARSDQYEIKGSEGSESLRELAERHKFTLNELGEISALIRESSTLPDYPQIKGRLDIKFDSLTSSFKEYSRDYILRNRESLSILIALYNLYGQGLPVFDPLNDFQTYLLVDSLLQKHHPDFEAAKMLHTQVLEAGTRKEGKGKDPRPQVGEIAPDFVSSRPDGSVFALSDLRGNYVLLSFWAGWSSLSREENPYLKEVWSSKTDFPFRILQVSFDGEADVWTGAIKEDGLDWDHVSDLRRWESAVADLYGIEKIPSNYLIDPEGKILARDLFGAELLNKFNNLNSKR